jgi:hypothetical protein
MGTMTVITLRSPLARSAAQSRSRSHAQASDAVRRAPEGDRLRRRAAFGAAVVPTEFGP